MAYLGDYALSTVIYGKFTTYQPSTGANFALAGSPALSVYKDNSTTQSTTGVTLTASFDSVTGLNHFAIDTSADGTFYAAGSNFDIVITTGTVDGVSVVGSVVGSFSINKVAALRPTTAARTLDVSAGGEAGVDWANVGSPTTSVNLSGTTIATTQQVDVNTIKTNPVVNAGTVTFPTGATLASTTNITAGTITTATNLTNAPTNGDFTATMKTSIGTAVAASAVASVTGNVGGNVTGSVGSVVGNVGGTVATVTNLTNAPTNGDFTATMKASIGTAVAASAVASVTGNVGGNVVGSVGSVVGAVGSVTGAVGSVTGNVGGNVTGSVGSVTTGGITANSFASGAIDAAALATTAVNEIRDSIVGYVVPELTGDPGATPELAEAIMLPYMAIRNARATSASGNTDTISNDAGATILTAAITDDGTTFTKAKYA